jgi:hypothetical protein
MTEEERRRKFEDEFGDLDALDQVCVLDDWMIG